VPENNIVEKQVDAPEKKYLTATELTVAKHKQDQRKNSRVTAPKLCSPTKLGAALSNWSLSKDFFCHEARGNYWSISMDFFFVVKGEEIILEKDRKKA